MDEREAFGEKLREAIRMRLGPNMEREFARRIKMDPTQLSRTLNGKVGKRPELETLQRFADGLGLPLRTLVDWMLPPEALEQPRGGGPALGDGGKGARQSRDHAAAPRAGGGVRPGRFERTLAAVAEAWLANLRMGLNVAEAQRGAGGTGTDVP
jgi:transcriptional regulator with XRE-family HTH domain